MAFYYFSLYICQSRNLQFNILLKQASCWGNIIGGTSHFISITTDLTV